MTTPEGEAVRVLFISQTGDVYEVLPPETVATMTGYSTKYIIYLCDVGKLIALKIRGVWWVKKHQDKIMRNVS